MRVDSPVRAYEERMAALEEGPLRAVRAANAARALAGALEAVAASAGPTRARPHPGGVPAWEAAAAAYVPGRRPDPDG
ncbi:hypothetical protein ACWEPA_22970 [Streptomyces filamentosus]